MCLSPADGCCVMSAQWQSTVEIGADIHSKPLLAFLLYNKISFRGAFVCPVISALVLRLINIYFTAAWLHRKANLQRFGIESSVLVQAGAAGWNSLPPTRTYMHTGGKKRQAEGRLHAVAACLRFNLKREAWRREKRKNRTRGRRRTGGAKPAGAPNQFQQISTNNTGTTQPRFHERVTNVFRQRFWIGTRNQVLYFQLQTLKTNDVGFIFKCLHVGLL